MSVAELMKRWEPLIKKASKRFRIPADWVREVVRLESGGRTMLAENMPMVSNRGALGLMQLLPATYSDMRAQYGLGKDPFNAHDNIFAGAAYLSWLRGRYGYPAMFTAYNDGPGNYEQRSAKGKQFPTETQNYLTAATLVLGGGAPANNPLLTQTATTPATIIPATLTVATPGPTFDAAAPASTPPATTTVSNNAPPVATTTATATSTPATAPTRTTGLREASLGNSCNFTKADGSSLSVDCADVSGVRAPLEAEYLPNVHAVLSVGRALETVRESADAVRRTVLAHGGHV
jgi:hypothetical protein